MSNEVSALDKLRGYLDVAFKRKFSKYDLENISFLNSGAGYLSDITFVDAVCYEESRSSEKFHLAIKQTKTTHDPVLKVCDRNEILMYKEVFPAFRELQSNKNVKVFDSFPKCLAAFSNGDNHVRIMENLKSLGYEMRDSKKTWDIHHLKMVLQEYGKLHSMSFSLREQNNERFNEIVSNFSRETNANLVALRSMETFFNDIAEIVRNGLENQKQTRLLETFKEIIKPGISKVLKDILEIDPDDQSVIVHGDPWNNNFLFKYEDPTKDLPSYVTILDWQVTRLASPVIDVSLFIYSVASAKELEHLEELLQIYYESFADGLRALGCNPETLFTFHMFKEHWEKFSVFGLLWSTLFLYIMNCQPSEDAVISFVSDQAFTNFSRKMKIDEGWFLQRFVVNIKHYADFEFLH